MGCSIETLRFQFGCLASLFNVSRRESRWRLRAFIFYLEITIPVDGN
jgi:hypothetical protein